MRLLFLITATFLLPSLIACESIDDYVGKTLVRGVKYEADTGELMLSPKEKVMGVAFSLLWRPSRNHFAT